MVLGLQNGAIGFRISLYSTTQRKTGTSSECFTADRAGGSTRYPLNLTFCTTQSQGSYLVTQQYLVEENLFAHCIKSY